MTEEELKAKIIVGIERAITHIREVAPKLTGNLAYVSVKYEQIGSGEWEIFIDEEIAPYAPYVNEKWISPRWNGKQNPNEGWWNNVVPKVVQEIAASVGGKAR